MTPAGPEAEHGLSLELNAGSAEQLEVAKQLSEHLIKAVRDRLPISSAYAHARLWWPSRC